MRNFNTRLSLVLIFLVLVTSSPLISQNTFEFRADIPSVKLTYDDLELILNDAHYLIKKYNPTVQDASYYITAYYGESSQTITDFKELNSLKKSKNLNYLYFSSGTVTDVSISLYKYGRYVSVRGSNLVEIQTIAKLIETGFSKHKYFLGEIYVKGILNTIASLMVFILIIGMPVKFNKNKVYFDRNRLKWKHYSIVVIYIIFLFDPFNFNVLSGFQIYNNEEVGFLRNNADLFTFLGFVIAFISLFSKPLKRIFTTNS